MSDPIQRGLVLFGQDRYDLADREFRKSLAQDPDDPVAHAYLALCLSRRKQPQEALREADEAVRLDPAWPFAHYARGVVLYDQERFADAEAAVEETLSLEPFDADAFGLLAGIRIARRLWGPALEAANKGLEIDPAHGNCTNFRALALVKLGRRDEAGATLESALAEDPENALTHANQGWACLHRGDHARALDHFREALRIDPELGWAQEGVIEALKARYLVYRLMLRFFLWMNRLSSSAQWLVLLLFIFGRRVLATLAEARPELAPFLGPILALAFGFLLMTWIASPLFDGLLMLHPLGRMALAPSRKRWALVITAGFLAAAAGFAVNLATGSFGSELAMTYFGLILIPLAVAARRPPGRPRALMSAAAAGIALLGLPALLYGLLGEVRLPVAPEQAGKLFYVYYIPACALSSWLPMVLDRRPDVH